MVLPFWCRPTQVVLESRPLNGHSSSSSTSRLFILQFITVHFHPVILIRFKTRPCHLNLRCCSTVLLDKGLLNGWHCCCCYTVLISPFITTALSLSFNSLHVNIHFNTIHPSNHSHLSLLNAMSEYRFIHDSVLLKLLKRGTTDHNSVDQWNYQCSNFFDDTIIPFAVHTLSLTGWCRLPSVHWRC